MASARRHGGRHRISHGHGALLQITTLSLLLSGRVSAFWRMPCDQFDGLYRIDPIVSPGQMSQHAHAVHGSTGFSFNSSFPDLRAEGTCTTCSVTQDKSAYWIPGLMWDYLNGTTVEVPSEGFLGYYFQNMEKPINAFPQNFRMLSGTNDRRYFDLPVPDPPQSDWRGADATQDALQQKAIGFNCLNFAAATHEGSLYRHFMPETEWVLQNCPDGLRLEVAFPACWDGVNIDSDDHKSHVAYASMVLTGTCPDSHPYSLPGLFFERWQRTSDFVGKPGRFMLANGDTTGFGLHADFISGWDEGFLQSAINECTNPSGLITDCPVFTIDDGSQGRCEYTAPEIAAVEDCRGPRVGLCGNPATDAVLSSPSAATTSVPDVAPDSVSDSAAPSTLQTAIRQASPHTAYVTDWVDATLTVTDFEKRAEPTGGLTAGDRRFFS